MGLECQSNAQNDQHKNSHGAGSNPAKFKKRSKILFFVLLLFIDFTLFFIDDLIFILLMLHFC